MGMFQKPTPCAGGFVAVASCDRCGQALAHPCFHGENVYGIDCFEVITGERVRWENYLTPSQQEERKARRAEWSAKVAERRAEYEARCKAFAAFNAEKISDVIEVLRARESSDFCQSIANDLDKGHNTLGTLPDMAFRIVADIYSKTFEIHTGKGSRIRNTEAYNNAWDRLVEIAERGIE